PARDGSSALSFCRLRPLVLKKAELARRSKTKLFDEHALAHAFDGAGRQVQQLERPERDANEPLYDQSHAVKDGTGLAVLAFGQPDREPDVAAVFPLERRVDRTVVHAGERDAFFQVIERLLADLAVSAHAIASQPARRRQFQMARERTIVAQQQQAL